jgi:hypothetical protein
VARQSTEEEKTAVAPITPRTMAAACALLLLVVGAGAAAPTTESCTAKGFSSLLRCENCEAFGEIVGDADLLRECQECCSAAQVEDDKTYIEARLQVPHAIDHFPEIDTFIKNHGSKFENLEIAHSNTRDATLVLIDDDEHEDKVSVKHYKADELLGYLQKKLQIE